MELNKAKNQNCEKCYQIKCKKCGWEPSDLEFEKISKGTLTNCPICGFAP